MNVFECVYKSLYSNYCLYLDKDVDGMDCSDCNKYGDCDYCRWRDTDTDEICEDCDFFK